MKLTWIFHPACRSVRTFARAPSWYLPQPLAPWSAPRIFGPPNPAQPKEWAGDRYHSSEQMNAEGFIKCGEIRKKMRGTNSIHGGGVPNEGRGDGAPPNMCSTKPCSAEGMDPSLHVECFFFPNVRRHVSMHPPPLSRQGLGIGWSHEPERVLSNWTCFFLSCGLSYN